MIGKLLSTCVLVTMFYIIQGSIFTDPNKLARLVKTQLTIKDILNRANNEELLSLPKIVLVALKR